MNVVVSQALATGLPVITTKHSGLPEQVKNRFNGLLVEEGNFRQLAEAILYMIENPQLWASFGIAGRKHVEENYDMNNILDRQIEIYKNVLDI
jgi:colanic acid/amylovoran biosynthesis glycosyltransferase